MLIEDTEISRASMGFWKERKEHQQKSHVLEVTWRKRGWLGNTNIYSSKLMPQL